MKSSAFRSRLAGAVRLTAKTGHEAGFCFYENYGNPVSTKTFWTPVIKGTTTDIHLRLEQPWDYEVEAGFTIDEHLPLMLIHLHPGTDSLALSERDLQNVLLPDDEIDHRPVYAVGMVSEQLEGALLFLRATSRIPDYRAGVVDQAWESYYEHRDLWPSPELAKALQVPGFLAACVVNYSIPRYSTYAVLKAAEDLRRFCGRDPKTNR